MSHGARSRRRGYCSLTGSCSCCPAGLRHRATVIAILFVELIERMTFYSINGNMVLFCTNVLLYTSTQAVTVNLIFTGIYTSTQAVTVNLIFTGIKYKTIWKNSII